MTDTWDGWGLVFQRSLSITVGVGVEMGVEVGILFLLPDVWPRKSNPSRVPLAAATWTLRIFLLWVCRRVTGRGLWLPPGLSVDV